MRRSPVPPREPSPPLVPDSLRDQLQATLGASDTLERELGGGGMSRVFVAREEAPERDVVVKVFVPSWPRGSAPGASRGIGLAAAQGPRQPRSSAARSAACRAASFGAPSAPT